MDGTLPITAGSRQQASTRAARRWWLLASGGAGVLVVAIVAVSVWAFFGGARGDSKGLGEVAPAGRDRLVVTITESGEIDAKRSVDVRCEVEGQSSILWVIEEGTVVKEGDKLVELDSADLAETVRTQDMKYKTAKAAYEKADKAYLIQQSTRESLLAVAGLDVKFGLLDLRKYFGTTLADQVIAEEGKVDFAKLVDYSDLGGDGLQQKRLLQTNIDLADEKLKRAESKVKWTRLLEEKGYVTGSELEADELAWKTQQVALDQARTALDLFLRYEFPKAAEKAYTDWLEFKREYERVDARTQSELDSAKADLENSRDGLDLEETRLKKVRDQFAKTTILAPQPGMVVYDTAGSRRREAPPMEVGSSVRHQQTLIKLPDMSEMHVKVKLHESVVKQAREGAPAFVTIEALPKERLTGKVTKIAVMPDRENWWLNPGLKTYTTEVTLDSTPPGLKPGMSAQVEILVDTRDDVLQVPISAVFVDKGFQVVYVKTATGSETRRVEAGLSNDQSVEIGQGLKEGEYVYLFKPDGAAELEVSGEEAKARRAEFERQAAEAKAKAKPQLPPGMPGLENLTPEQIKGMREKLETLPKEQRDEIMKRMREAGLKGVPGETPPGEKTKRPDRPAGKGRRDRGKADDTP